MIPEMTAVSSCVKKSQQTKQCVNKDNICIFNDMILSQYNNNTIRQKVQYNPTNKSGFMYRDQTNHQTTKETIKATLIL